MKDFAAIYAFVRAIPPGRVMGYGEVGAAVGVTARTVGWAMSVIVEGDDGGEPVPWHRVVGADGYLRIARRSPELRAEQEARLEAEGVTFTPGGLVERRHFVGAESADESAG
jgi:methylated-DNA-protein-cysteine methyltransferase related protein